MSQHTSLADVSTDRHVRPRIRDRIRRAIQEMNSAPRSPAELRIRWY
jgi:hypothetical protein